MTQDMRRRTSTATTVLVLVGLLGGCGVAGDDDPVASADIETQEQVAEDQDNPTPTPPLPERDRDCDSSTSVDAARTVAGSSMAMVSRPAATPLSEISASAPTVIFGDIVGVERGEARPLEPEEDLGPEVPVPEPEVQLMANVLLDVDHAVGQEASSVSPNEIIAVPLTLLPEAPADDAYANYRDITHDNVVNDLRCALPKVGAAVFVARLDPAPAAGELRRAELPTLLWMTDPAAIVLQTDEQRVASLDAAVPLGGSGYFAGATTLEDVVAGVR